MLISLILVLLIYLKTNFASISISFDDIKQSVERKFIDVKDAGVYREVIKVFNEKGIAKSIGHFMSIMDKDYCKTVLGMLKME